LIEDIPEIDENTQFMGIDVCHPETGRFMFSVVTILQSEQLREETLAAVQREADRRRADGDWQERRIYSL
jgi:hypothetical protein